MRRCLVLILAGLMVLCGATAGASQVSPAYRIESVASKWCLTTVEGTREAKVWPCLAGARLRWSLEARSDGSFWIKNVASKQCLSETPGTRDVYMNMCVNDAYRQWRVEEQSGGSVWIRNVATKQCLAEGGGSRKVSAQPCGQDRTWRKVEAN